MRFLVLASDYDETLATYGRIDETTMDAISRLLASGRKIVLVTGRTLDDLSRACPDLRIFTRVIAENGALLHDPVTRATRTLAEPPPPAFFAALRERGVTPLARGHVIVATREPHQATVLDTIKELGMGHQVVFNKGAVMVLPSGVDKGTGLLAALEELGLSPHNVVGVGDAENDHAFLLRCELAAAVHNALPLVRERADLVTRGEASEGVVELISDLVATDLARFEDALVRHHFVLGKSHADNTPFRVPPYGASILVAGPSGSGKSQATLALLERIIEAGYQTCLVDPEGDYDGLANTISIGEPDKPPSLEEVFQLLKKPSEQVVVNLLGVALADRPAFFSTMLPRLQALRASTGRPHWLVVDEAHHLLPSSWVPAADTLLQNLGSLLAVTVHAGNVSPAILRTVKLVLAVGPNPAATLASFCDAIGRKPPRWEDSDAEPGEVVAWQPAFEAPPFRVAVHPAEAVRRRHRRKYAHGDLGVDRSFYFRGPDGKLNLRAQNLEIFLQMADGIDDATWLFHLRRGDYSRWLREHVKDQDLALAVERIEREDLTVATSRSLVRRAIEERYTLPA